MHLSDLFGAEIVDEAGRSGGHVHDALLVQDGPMVGTFGASLRLAALLAGPRPIGARFGYGRRDMHGPFLVKLLASWLYREGRYVEWDRIRAIEPDRILISGSVDDLPTRAPVS
jgi:hypothetical protein